MKFYRKSLRPKLLFYDEGGVTFTGCECTIQFDELKQTLQTLKNQGIDTAIETNASHSRLTELFEHIDQLIMDCKEIQRDCDKKFSGLPDCIKIAKTQVEVAKNMALAVVKDLALIIVRNKDYYDKQEKKRINDIDTKMKLHEAEKARLERCILSSYEEYTSGTISQEEYIISRTACRKTIDEVELEMDELWKELHRTVRVDDEAMMQCRILKEYNPEVLSMVVEKIRIYDNRRIEVVFGTDDVFSRELPADAVC